MRLLRLCSRLTVRPASLVPGTRPLAVVAVRPLGVDAARPSTSSGPVTRVALWARGVTPTCGVPFQCISRRLLPSVRAMPPLAPSRRGRGPRDAQRRDAWTDAARSVTPRPRERSARVVLASWRVVVAASPPSIGAARRSRPPRSRRHGPSAARRPRLGVAGRSVPLGAPVRGARAPLRRRAPRHRPATRSTARSCAHPPPASIAFAGVVAGRGILTIDHGDGLVTTLEPVESALEPGARGRRGRRRRRRSRSAVTPPPGTLHFGVRLHGEYINPLLLLGGVPRAVLLPCCD